MQSHQDIWFSVSDEEEHIYFRAFHKPNPILDFLPWPIRVPSIVFPDGSSMNTAGGGGGGGSPAGSDGQIQFYNDGAFGASSGLTYQEAFRNESITIGFPSNQSQLLITSWDDDAYSNQYLATIQGSSINISVVQYLTLDASIDPRGQIKLLAQSGVQIGEADTGVPLTGSSILNIQNLPNSSAGLNPGDVWNNNGVLNIA